MPFKLENKINSGLIKHNIPKKANEYGHKLIQDYVNFYDIHDQSKNDGKREDPKSDN